METVEVDASGGLALTLPGGGSLRFRAPVTYQEWGGVRQPVASRYRLGNGKSVGFVLGDYDVTRPLVIDPVLDYGTYLGGSSYDRGHGIAVDNSGNAYIAGFTAGSGFPTKNAYDAFFNGTRDQAGITRLALQSFRAAVGVFLGFWLFVRTISRL